MSAKVIEFPNGAPVAALGFIPPVPKSRPRGKAPLTVRPLARPPRALTADETQLQERMLDAYFAGRRASKNHTPKTIRRDRGYAQQFLTYVGQPVWAITEDDFETWAAHLAIDRHLSPGTQRAMQGAIATFFHYLSRHTAFKNEAHTRFHGALLEVAHSENRVVHTTDVAIVRPRRHLTGREFEQFLTIIDSTIEVCAIDYPRRLTDLQRDKAMFTTFYAFGLRLSEGRGLDVGSFRANPDIPELGEYGYAHVMGKGSNGSGPRFRAVPAIHDDIRAVLEWYLQHVRPRYKNADTEPALWLSEHGNRLSRSSIWSRYKNFVQLAGFDPKLMAPHGLRHMSVTHEAEADVPLSFTQARHGHRDGATTQKYTHLSERFVRDNAKELVHRTRKPPKESE